MSMNQFMHPRNIYKQPPNFKQLAIEYPEFRKHVSMDISGKVTIDFKNVESLRALTCTLLKKDFGLDVQMPANKLIPTVPLRLNYILWVEDLLNVANCSDNIKGIDIGTGAACIYPLLAASKNKWAMIATEIDQESIDYATRNVKNNNLENLIKIVGVNRDTLLAPILENCDEEYDFCMCNPPFFSTTQELHPFFKARKQSRPHPKNAFCASVDEVVAEGGEVEYISKLITESKKFTKRVKIYTTMIGHKYNLPPLKKYLREADVVSFKQTEFCQGHTTRWGLAWTFRDIDLTKIPETVKQKTAKPLYYALPKDLNRVSAVSEKLVKIFQDLQLEFQQVKHVKHLTEYVVVAYNNTWSHQRRKRREKLKSETSDNNNTDLHNTCDKLADLDFGGASPKKRQLEDDEDSGFYNAKKLKVGVNESVPNLIYLKAKISVMKVEACVGMELVFYEGKGTKEALHQVLQYIKNNLIKTEEK